MSEQENQELQNEEYPIEQPEQDPDMLDEIQKPDYPNEQLDQQQQVEAIPTPQTQNKPPKPDRVKTDTSTVQLKYKMTKAEFAKKMLPISSMNTPIKANNKFIMPTSNHRADKIFQAKINTVGKKGTIDLTDRFHSREDPHTQVNWSRRTQDLAPNSYRSEYINTMGHQMHKHKNQVIQGDNTKRYKTTNQSFSDVGKDISTITTPKHPQNFSKDQYTTTQWQKDTNQLKEIDQRPINGQFNSTTTIKPNYVTSWKGGTVNKEFLKDISKFNSLKLKYK